MNILQYFNDVDYPVAYINTGLLCIDWTVKLRENGQEFDLNLTLNFTQCLDSFNLPRGYCCCP
jgi:hypothetical protein